MVKLLLAVFFLAVFFGGVNQVNAVNEFATSYDVAYDVGTDGITQVTQKVTLKNLTSNYYASNFTLTIGSTTVSDITASDEVGVMESTVEAKDNKTSITVKFNQQIAGTDKKQTFTLGFKSKDFAQSLGKTWEVNLPKIPEAENIESYNLVLSVPNSFGDPTSVSPTPLSQSQTFDRLFFVFDKEQLQKGGVSLNFGTFQVFDFALKYHLENNSLFPVLTSITLPPDTNYQNIFLSRISPEPENVTIDEDGNYLAWYKLSRRSRQDVTVSGSAKLYLNPRVKKVLALSKEQYSVWTKSDKYWEKDNPAISSVLAEIFKDSKPKSSYEQARLINNFVVKTLKYDTSRLNGADIERLGAVTALNNPASAVCMEFTDLFISLARAAGIPARELDGFAYSQNKNLRPLSLSLDLLHAWPEYFDNERGWVMVDPTWENTSGGVSYFNKFDLNHLVLTVKGLSSTLPYTSDDVKVNISEADFVDKPQLNINATVADTIWAGFPTVLNVRLSNQGNSVQGPSTLSLASGQISILDSSTVNLGPIPPYGFVTYKFNLRTPFSWQSFEDVIEVTVAGQKISQKVKVQPFFFFQSVPYLLPILIASIAFIYGGILGLHVYRKKIKIK